MRTQPREWLDPSVVETKECESVADFKNQYNTCFSNVSTKTFIGFVDGQSHCGKRAGSSKGNVMYNNQWVTLEPKKFNKNDDYMKLKNFADNGEISKATGNLSFSANDAKILFAVFGKPKNKAEFKVEAQSGMGE